MSLYVSPAEAVARLKAFDRKILPKITRGAFYRALDAGRQRSLAELRKTEIGRMVQRRGDVQLELGRSSKSRRWSSPQALASLAQSVIPLIVRRSVVKAGIFGGIKGGLEAAGFAALIETGGKTRSHQIKRIRLGGYSRRRGTREKQLAAMPPLTFQVGGRWVSKRVVTHPGSKIPRNPFLEAGARTAAEEIPKAFEDGLAAGLAEAGLV